VTAGYIVLEKIAMVKAGDVAALRRLDTFIGHLPDATIVLTGFAIGAATSWLGWQAGKKPAVRVAAAQAA
jgi:hypothetical protein